MRDLFCDFFYDCTPCTTPWVLVVKLPLDKPILAALTYENKPVGLDGKRLVTAPNIEDRPYIILDSHPTAPTGFGVEVHRNKKTWILRVRVAGGEHQHARKVKVGEYPMLTIGPGLPPDKDARHQARLLYEQMKSGVDPNAEKKTAKAKARAKANEQVLTVRGLFERYIEAYLKGRRVSEETLISLRGAMKRIEKDQLLDKPAEEFTYVDVDTICTRIATIEGHQTAAERTLQWIAIVYVRENDIRTTLAHAEGRQPVLLINPVSVFSALNPGRIRSRREREEDIIRKGIRRPLSAKADYFQRVLDEIFLRRQQPENRTGMDYLLTTLLLGGRLMETAKLQWYREDMTEEELTRTANFVTLDSRALILNDTKNGYQLKLPIADSLLALLSARQSLTNGSRWVFPAESRYPGRKTEHYNHPYNQIKRLVESTGVKFSMHDLRRTFAQVVNRMALPSLLVKQLLNHRAGGDSTMLYAALSHEQLLEHLNNIEKTILSYATTNPFAGTRND